MIAIEEILVRATEFVVPVIDAIALVVIVFGTVEALINVIRYGFMASAGREGRAVWLRYARWLVAGLTFQLAADIIETAVAPTWDDIGRLGVIAVIRTFLDYFLERDIGDVRERRHEPAGKAPPDA